MFSWILFRWSRNQRQFAWTMGPDDKRVIHIVKPTEGLVGHPLQSHFFKVLHEEVGNDRG
jgi:hypothetical protein